MRLSSTNAIPLPRPTRWFQWLALLALCAGSDAVALLHGVAGGR